MSLPMKKNKRLVRNCLLDYNFKDKNSDRVLGDKGYIIASEEQLQRNKLPLNNNSVHKKP